MKRGPIVKLRFLETTLNTLCGLELYIDMTCLRELTIGRSPENVVVVPDPTVSRRHAAIVKSGDKLILKDLGSKNGTFLKVGDQFVRIREHELSGSDVIRLGLYTMLQVDYLRGL